MKNNQNETSLSKNTGHWTKDEHQRFINGILKYGKDWKKIVELVGTRSGNQVRSHAQKYFISLEKQNSIRSLREKRKAFCLAWQVLGLSFYSRCLAAVQSNRENVVPETRPVKVVFEEADSGVKTGLEEIEESL